MTSRSTNNVAGRTVGNQTEIHRAAVVAVDIHVMPGTGAAGAVGETADSPGAHSRTGCYRREEHRGVRHTEDLALGEGREAHRIADLDSVGEGQEERHIDLGRAGVQEAHRTEIDLLEEGTLQHRRRRRRTG